MFDIYGALDNITFMPAEGGRPKKWKKMHQYKNWSVWRMWFSILLKRALARYDFENLPETVSERVLKFALLYHASVCFFEKDGSLMALPGGAGSEGLTVYGDFTNSYVYGYNGFNKNISLWLPGEKELPFLGEGYQGQDKGKPIGVWFRENPDRYPFIEVVLNYSVEIADTWRKITISRKNAATPYIIITDEQTLPSIKKVFEDRDDNAEYLALSSGILDPSRVLIEPVQTSIEGIKAHTDLIEWYINQFNGLCGYTSNANANKESGMPGVEVTATNETNTSNIDALIRYIQQGLDEVNMHFNTDIKVVPGKNTEEGDDQNVFQRMDRNAGSGLMGA